VTRDAITACFCCGAPATGALANGCLYDDWVSTASAAEERVDTDGEDPPSD
jgi:hypothetical protein